jgi:1-pyrroline-5-carboxylate dehydrogenase
VYGLTAGLYTGDAGESERFVNEIHAGVVYVNREAGATTGAWPGIQPFGGWDGSGTTGVGAGGIHYLQRYMREQSRTFVER